MLRRLCLISLLVLAGCAPAVDVPPPSQGVIEARPAENWTAGAMVAAANPLAVQAGLQILREGGTAIDAAIAVQAVLGLVEPQSSGLGGGAFLLSYDAATGDVVAYDGRETAPAGATPDMFLDASGKPLDFGTAVRSGRSVGVPGVVAMLLMAHQDKGKLPLSRLLQPAIQLAEQGFEVSQRLNTLISMAIAYGKLPPDAAAYLTLDGTTPLPFGHILKNPAYADTLRRIAEQGTDGFYKGPVAAAMLEAVRRGEMPGTLAQADLDAYQPRRLEPLCRTYRVDLVCGMPSPSSGGLAVLMALGMLDGFDMKRAGPTAAGWHLLIEAERLAYADRDLYAADDRFVAVPVEGLLDPAYLRSRAGLVRPAQAMESVQPGVPAGAPKRAADPSAVSTGTSHFSIVDAQGNAVSMTTTVESLFGSQRMAAGFFLNNQLTDFSFAPTDAAGTPIANAVAPGKKPRSSMAPTLVFRNGQFRLAVGSPGGNSIIAYVLKTVVAVLDWDLGPQAAIALPNVIARGDRVTVEAGFDAELRAALTAMGHTILDSRAGEASGLHAILLKDGRLVGGADPRREGQARSP